MKKLAEGGGGKEDGTDEGAVVVHWLDGVPLWGLRVTKEQGEGHVVGHVEADVPHILRASRTASTHERQCAAGRTRKNNGECCTSSGMNWAWVRAGMKVSTRLGTQEKGRGNG